MVGSRQFQEIKDWSPGYINVAPEHVTIVAECQACGEQREFDRKAVPRSMQQHLVSEIEPHLRCATCSAKAGKLRFGYYVGGN